LTVFSEARVAGAVGVGERYEGKGARPRAMREDGGIEVAARMRCAAAAPPLREKRAHGDPGASGRMEGRWRARFFGTAGTACGKMTDPQEGGTETSLSGSSRACFAECSARLKPCPGTIRKVQIRVVCSPVAPKPTVLGPWSCGDCEEAYSRGRVRLWAWARARRAFLKVASARWRGYSGCLPSRICRMVRIWMRG
jgi:hypothetical protein